MPQQPSTYTLGGYQSRRCLPLSVPFGGQDFRNGRDRCCTSCTKCALKGMGITVTLSQFRSEQSHYLDAAQREPVTILSRGPRRRAVMGGTVIDSGPASGFGQWIRIQHDDGSIAVYGHMETLDVTVGEGVTAGQRITGMGNRGFPPALTCTSSFTRLAAERSTRCPGSPSTASPSNLPALTRTGPDTGTGGSDWAGGTRLRPQRRFSFIADTART